MYLVNTRTGRRVYLAKYYPSTGWYPPHKSISDLSDAFDEAEFDLRRNPVDVLQGRACSGGGMDGEEWSLEYGA
jgi:hypothetical protein